jgi:PKD repeat protein
MPYIAGGTSMQFRWPARARGRTRLTRRSRGQSLVEFALVLPVLLLLVLIGIDFGRVYLGWVNLQNLSRIAANFAANNPTAWTGAGDSNAQALYQRLVLNDARAMNCELPQVAGQPAVPEPTFAAGTNLGGTAEVQLTCTFDVITPIIGEILGDKVPVSASATFPIKSGGVAGIPVGGGGGTGGGNEPTADFIGTPVSGAAPLEVTFTDLSLNAPTAWTWTFGDGGSSNTQNPTHTYASPGTYTVSLTATNAAGFDTLTRSAYIVVSGTTAADFSATPTSGFAPLAVAFTDLSSGGPTSWSWSFGDGGTSTVRNPSHTYSSAGTYTVTLTVNGPGGPSTQTKTGYIVVGAAQCIVPNVSDGATKKVQATSTLHGLGFAVATVGDSGNWQVRVQSPQGGLQVACGSTVTLYQ